LIIRQAVGSDLDDDDDDDDDLEYFRLPQCMNRSQQHGRSTNQPKEGRREREKKLANTYTYTIQSKKTNQSINEQVESSFQGSCMGKILRRYTIYIICALLN
jgi:transcription initiation factor IIE alpha subunit